MNENIVQKLFRQQYVAPQPYAQEIIEWIESENKSNNPKTLIAELLQNNQALIDHVVEEILSYFDWIDKENQIKKSSIQKIIIIHEKKEYLIYPKAY